MKHQLENGMTDWEAVFELPPDGLIPVIESAASPETLKKCMIVVIDSLFTRKNDGDIKTSYLSTLNELLPDNMDPEKFAKAKGKIAHLLRVIKDERIRKVAMLAEQQKAAEGVDEVFEEDRSEDGAIPKEPMEQEKQEEQSEPEEAPKDDLGNSAIKAVFADVCWEVINQRFEVLQSRLNEGENESGALPFILSTKFAAKFEGVLRKHVIPEMASKCRGVIVRSSHAPEDQQFSCMRDSFENRLGRKLLWDAWKLTWDEVMLEREVPAKPKDKKEKKKGLMGVLKGEKENAFLRPNELTPEQWEKVSSETRTSNKRVREIWKILTEETEEYQAPKESDGSVLKNLFGRSATGLRKQIAALKQIVQQGGNIGKSFDTYKHGKNLDVAILAASYQHPELFISNPKHKVIKSMMGGFSDSQKKQQYALVMRYLSSQL